MTLLFVMSIPVAGLAQDTGPGADMLSPMGYWKTIDDKTGLEKSIVKVFEDNGQLRGKIETLFRQPGEDPDPVCDECEGSRKDKPIRGMEILWDMRPKGDIWAGGRILDPKNGKIYKCKLTVIEGGKKLDVRGYIGFSLLGRTQTWIRVNKEVID